MFGRAQAPLPTRPDWLCVQPEALRYALVADMFYGVGSLPVVSAVERLGPGEDSLETFVIAVGRRLRETN